MIFFQKLIKVNNKIITTKIFNHMKNKKNLLILEALEDLETKKKRGK